MGNFKYQQKKKNVMKLYQIIQPLKSDKSLRENLVFVIFDVRGILHNLLFLKVVEIYMKIWLNFITYFIIKVLPARFGDWSMSYWSLLSNRYRV